MDPIVRQQPDKMTERGEGAVENVRGIAPVDMPAVARQIDVETRQHCLPFSRARADRVTWPDQERAVHAVGGDGIGGGEFPPRIDRLHDFKAVRDPFQAGE